MRKLDYIRKAAVICLSGSLVLGLAGCASSSNGDEASTSANAGNSPTSPANSGNDADSTEGSKYVNPYKLNNIDVFEIDASKYVDVSAWKDAEITAEDAKEDEYKVLYAIAAALSNTYGIKAGEITDRAVQGGDTVTIDFKGYVDGEELEGGSGEDFDLSIGSGSFISGFEEGLIGYKTGDEVTLELTFPDPYPNNTELSGKPVKFIVDIKKISGFDNVSDEDISEASDGVYNTYADFETAFREKEAEEYLENIIWQKVMGQVKELEVCETLSDDFINTYLYTYGAMGEYYNMSVETILYYYYGYKSVDDFKEALKSTAEDYAEQTCAVLAIADMEGIEVTEDEVADELKKQLESSGYESAEELAEAGTTMSDIKFSLLLDKVEEYMYQQIKVN